MRTHPRATRHQERVQVRGGMRFIIEQVFLTDEAGRVITPRPPAPQLHVVEAGDPAEAVRLFIRDHGGRLLGESRTYGEGSTVATVQNGSVFYTVEALRDLAE